MMEGPRHQHLHQEWQEPLLVQVLFCFLGDFFLQPRPGCTQPGAGEFRGTRFPFLLGEEPGSFSYVEHLMRFELAEHGGFEEGRRRARWCRLE